MLKILKSLFNKKTESLKPVLDKGAIILDVRSAAEYRQGHIKGSKNIPLDEIKLKSDMIKKWNKPVVTVCRSGARSQVARNLLKTLEIETYNGGSWNGLKNKYSL